MVYVLRLIDLVTILAGEWGKYFFWARPKKTSGAIGHNRAPSTDPAQREALAAVLPKRRVMAGVTGGMSWS